METVDRKLSLQDYELFYRHALLAKQQIHQVVPKTIKSVGHYQDMCRVCGCHNDGHFLDLDKYQDFEFEPTITTYRMLFQRTSLQFQFYTMPDLPTCICRTCAYKVKIFYLMTRQFLIGQQIMRSAVTDIYRDKYGTEAPEQLEDLQQLRKQLNMIPKQGTLLKSAIGNRSRINAGLSRRSIKLKRSTSGDARLAAIAVTRTGCSTLVGKLRKTTTGCNLSMTTVNNQQVNKSPRLDKKPQIAPSPVNNKKGSAEVRTITRLDRTGARQNTSRKKLSPVECFVTPRMTKKSIRANEPENLKNGLTDSKDQGQTSQADSRDMPLSKAQLQKKLLERRKQWR